MTEKPLRQLRLIWAALVGGVATYTLVIFGLMKSGSLGLGTLDPSLMNIIGGLVVLYMAAIVLVRRMMIARIPADADSNDRLARYRVATIVGLGLMESGGLIVITLGMMSDAATWVLAGGGAAATLMFMARPSEADLGR